MENNEIHWESFKETGLNRVRATPFKRKDETVDDRVRKTMSQWKRHKAPAPTKSTNLSKSIKPTIQKLKEIKKRINNEILVKKITRILDKY